MLTVGLWWPELRSMEVVGEVRRRVGAELDDGVGAGVLRAPGLHGSTRGVPVKPEEGLAGPEWHRRRGIAAADELTGGRSRAEIRRG